MSSYLGFGFSFNLLIHDSTCWFNLLNMSLELDFLHLLGVEWGEAVGLVDTIFSQYWHRLFNSQLISSCISNSSNSSNLLTFSLSNFLRPRSKGHILGPWPPTSGAGPNMVLLMLSLNIELYTRVELFCLCIMLLAGLVLITENLKYSHCSNSGGLPLTRNQQY